MLAIPLRQSRAWQAGALLLGTLFLALSSHVEVPMVPVPMTLQTLAVTLVGAVYGWRLGALTVIAWLCEAMLGLPVLATAPGPAAFVGPTAGYLAAFPVAAALTGWLAERGWNARLPATFAAMLAGNALCLLLGGAWLSVVMGPERAMALGVIPFLLGGLVKSALGAVVVKALALRA